MISTNKDSFEAEQAAFLLTELFSNGQNASGRLTENNLNLSSEVISNIARSLGLSFITEQEEEGNVCMANNEEVRDDFRLTFTPIDIVDYVYAVLNSPGFIAKCGHSVELETLRIPYPTSENFWELVREGREFRRDIEG